MPQTEHHPHPAPHHPPQSPPEPPGTPSASYRAFLVGCSAGPGPHPRALEVDGVTSRLDFGWHDGPIWHLDGGAWVTTGTIRVTFACVVMNGAVGLSWGTFRLRDRTMANCDGTWAWDWGKQQDGHGAGVEGPATHGRMVTLTFLAVDPVDVPPPPADPCGGVDPAAAAHLVISVG